MGLKPEVIKEQANINVSRNPITATVTDVEVDSGVGAVGIDPNKETFAQGIVGSQTATDALRSAMGNTPITPGVVNEVVLKYLYKTGPFELKYSFSNDVKLSGGTIPKNVVFTTKNANYIGLTNDGQTISVDVPKEIEETEDDSTTTDKEARNRNEKISRLFNSVGIKLGVKEPVVIYFRKNIRPILRRLKKQFPEYNINFSDQATRFDGEDVIVDNFITIKDILFENYTESVKQLKDLRLAKEAQKKDKKMGAVLDKEIEKENKKLLALIKPKLQKIFKEYTSSLTDEDMINFILSLDVFLEGLKGSELGYPQYKITFKDETLKEQEEEKIIEPPKEMLIHLNDDQDVIFISRKYPCTVSVDGKQTGQNTIFISDVTSPYVYKGGAKTSNNQQNLTGRTQTDKEETESYTLPIYNQLQDDKGKDFEVTMSVDIDPQVYLSQSNPHVGLLQKHEGELWKYKVKMLDNGFELDEIKTNQGQTTKVPGEAKLRFLFSRGTQKVQFGKRYQVTVLQDNNTLGKLNITLGKINRDSAF